MEQETILPTPQASTPTPEPVKDTGLTIDDIDFFGTEDVEPASNEGTKQAPAKLKVKYNGAEQEFDLATQAEEVQALIQKGMNYDHVVGERDSIKNSEEMGFLKKMAEKAGLPDTKAFIQKLQKDMETQEIQARVSQLVSEGMLPKHAQQMAELEMKTKQVTAPPAPAPTMTDELKTGFQELFNEYPDAKQFKKFGDLPEEVQEAINGGKSPLVAYQKYLLAQATAKAGADAHNAMLKERDLGGVTTGQPVIKEDPFISGLFGK